MYCVLVFVICSVALFIVVGLLTLFVFACVVGFGLLYACLYVCVGLAVVFVVAIVWFDLVVASVYVTFDFTGTWFAACGLDFVCDLFCL